MRYPPFGFSAAAVGGEFAPLAADANTAQVAQGLRALEAPAHAGGFHAVLNEMPTRSLNDAGCGGDRVALGQLLIIAHSIVVDLEITADFVELLGFLAA
ncbi:MAG: hypothetical protein WA970_24395 [Gammaproteobacteria bacterium]